MGKTVLRLDKLQEDAKKRWEGHDPDSEVRFIVKKNKKSTVVTAIERKIKPESEPVPVVAIVQRPKFMSPSPVKHFIKAMSYIGIEFCHYVPKKVKVPKQKKKHEPNQRVQIDPISGKMIYKKGNPGPPKPTIERPPTDYDNISRESIFKKYGV